MATTAQKIAEGLSVVIRDASSPEDHKVSVEALTLAIIVLGDAVHDATLEATDDEIRNQNLGRLDVCTMMLTLMNDLAHAGSSRSATENTPGLGGYL
jgi:hypothetical protein